VRRLVRGPGSVLGRGAGIAPALNPGTHEITVTATNRGGRSAKRQSASAVVGPGSTRGRDSRDGLGEAAVHLCRGGLRAAAGPLPARPADRYEGDLLACSRSRLWCASSISLLRADHLRKRFEPFR